jgi:hypothetical protein
MKSLSADRQAKFETSTNDPNSNDLRNEEFRILDLPALLSS